MIQVMPACARPARGRTIKRARRNEEQTIEALLADVGSAPDEMAEAERANKTIRREEDSV